MNYFTEYKTNKCDLKILDRLKLSRKSNLGLLNTCNIDHIFINDTTNIKLLIFTFYALMNTDKCALKILNRFTSSISFYDRIEFAFAFCIIIIIRLIYYFISMINN